MLWHLPLEDLAPCALDWHSPLLPKFNSVSKSGRGGAAPDSPHPKEGQALMLAKVPSQDIQGPRLLATCPHSLVPVTPTRGLEGPWMCEGGS